MSLAHDLLIEPLGSKGPTGAKLIEGLNQVSGEGASKMLGIPLARTVCRDSLFYAVAAGYWCIVDSASVQEKEDVRLGILKETAHAAPLEPACIFPGIATSQVSSLEACLGQTEYSPRPVELFVGTQVAVASIVDDQQMVASSMIHEGGHLDTKFDAGVWHGGYRPLVGMVVVFLAEDLFERDELVLYRGIIFPTQEQDRGTCVRGRLLHFTVYEHGSILQMPGKGLEAMSFSGGGRGGGGC